MADGAEKFRELKVVDDAKQCNAATVEIAKELLERAQSGEIQSAVIVGFYPTGGYTVIGSDMVDVLHKIGALRQIEFDILSERERK